jgi:hypothetical protein
MSSLDDGLLNTGREVGSLNEQAWWIDLGQFELGLACLGECCLCVCCSSMLQKHVSALGS